MSRDWRLFLDDLIASAQKIARLAAVADAQALKADEARFDAVLFNLQVIGEASKQLSVEVRQTRIAFEHFRITDLLARVVLCPVLQCDPACTEEESKTSVTTGFGATPRGRVTLIPAPRETLVDTSLALSIAFDSCFMGCDQPISAASHERIPVSRDQPGL